MPRPERGRCVRCGTLIRAHLPSIKCVNCDKLYHRRCARNLNRHNKRCWKCNLCTIEPTDVSFNHAHNVEVQNEVINNPIAQGIQNPSAIDPIMLNEIFDNHNDDSTNHNNEDAGLDLQNETYAISDDIESYCEQYYLIPKKTFQYIITQC